MPPTIGAAMRFMTPQ
jgi:hypothetical protein